MAGKKAGGFTCYVGVGPNEGGEGTGVLEDGIHGVADPVVHGHFGHLALTGRSSNLMSPYPLVRMGQIECHVVSLKSR
jgi:hypothetical protein